MALFDFLKDKKSGTAGAQPAEAKRQLVELALDSIVPNPAQPRKTFDDRKHIRACTIHSGRSD